MFSGEVLKDMEEEFLTDPIKETQCIFHKRNPNKVYVKMEGWFVEEELSRLLIWTIDGINIMKKTHLFTEAINSTRQVELNNQVKSLGSRSFVRQGWWVSFGLKSKPMCGVIRAANKNRPHIRNESIGDLKELSFQRIVTS